LVTEHDKPAIGAQLRLRPEPETPFNHQRARTTSTDQNGHFSISNVPPGKYLMTAKLSPNGSVPVAASDPQPVTLREKDHQSLQLILQDPKSQ
jgi:hypothetical protein